MSESKVAAADRLSFLLLVRIGSECREARVAGGLTLRAVGARVGISAAELSRIERGKAPWVDLPTLQRIAFVVGLRLWVRTYADGDAIRDQGHADLEAGLREVLGPALRRLSEVPFDGPGDRRAWDMTLDDGEGHRAGVEFDTRISDAQAYLRRMALKRRDGRVDRLILVVLDTRSNRIAVNAARGMFEDAFTIDDPTAKASLAAGRLPDRDALLFVRPIRRSKRAAPSRPT